MERVFMVRIRPRCLSPPDVESTCRWIVWGLVLGTLIVSRAPPTLAQESVAPSVETEEQPDKKVDELDMQLLQIRQHKLKVIEDAATFCIYGAWILLIVLFLFCCVLIYRVGNIPNPRPFNPKTERRRPPLKEMMQAARSSDRKSDS